MRTWWLLAKLSVRKLIRAPVLAGVGLFLVPGGAVAQDLIGGGRFTWDGSESDLWADAGNWTIGRPPGSNADLTLRILDNDGVDPIVGAFAGLPEGGVMETTRGLLVRVTYQGGDGNDVELRVLNPPPLVDSIARLATGFMQIQGHGVPNVLYTLEASTNLQPGSWSAIAADLVDGNGLFDLIDVDSTNHPMRFYRVSSP